MSKVKKGDMIPFFILKDHDNHEFNIRNLIGSPMVIYFYPRNDTPGCTREACSFRDSYEDFIAAGVAVIGISEDNPESHRKFREKYSLPFTLLSDTGNRVRDLFGVPTNLFGLIPGRVTYIVDGHGKVCHVFNSQYRTAQHVKEALRIIRKMN